ncbi:Na+/H+ antiporter subunit G [Pseudooctadecabacter jejudonensis]|uniref:Na(+)/H(+) antiporter subunit G n=1 Tax=Pseudooctadecabacter jejudonensis TaxID=1391910 RepID=A0A1Y5RWJ0_9RHOB|nr:Na+/H+ antiporter subunit G [Pseudooctadecabacter jejudonensis]SLN26852.1 Na(+)/H(+) antiporter subunit G [Pseudooctadecabacter jejudonensis]
MNWAEIGTYFAAICLFVGAFFALVGTFGLIKLNDSMTRLHAPTKVGTMGIGMILLASMVYSFVQGQGSLHELLIMAFLFVTAPISANFISKVNIHRRSCDTPPELAKTEEWSTLVQREEDAGAHPEQTLSKG